MGASTPIPAAACPLLLLASQVLHALLQNLADAVVTYIKYQVRLTGLFTNLQQLGLGYPD